MKMCIDSQLVVVGVPQSVCADVFQSLPPSTAITLFYVSVPLDGVEGMRYTEQGQ